MKSILDFYEKAVSNENPIRAHACFSIAFLLFIYISAFIVHTYLFYELDKIAIMLKYPTVGCKTVLLIFGLFYSPLLTVKRDILIPEPVWHSMSLLCITLFAGLIIVFKPPKERVCVETTWYMIAFQAIGTLSSSILGIYHLLSSNGSLLLITVYITYAVLFIQKGKSPTTYAIPTLNRNTSIVKKVFDKILVDPEDSTHTRWMSAIVSPLVMGNTVYYTFIREGTVGWILSTGIFLTGSLISLKSKKSSAFRNAYTFVSSCIILKSVAENFYMITYFLAPGIARHWPGYIFLNIIRLGFPLATVLLIGTILNRYKLCFSLAISTTIHILLFQKASLLLLMQNPSGLNLVDKFTSFSLVFSAISAILLFVNNEIRTGLFETEVGIVLILLYVMYLLCLLSSDSSLSIFQEPN